MKFKIGDRVFLDPELPINKGSESELGYDSIEDNRGLKSLLGNEIVLAKDNYRLGEVEGWKETRFSRVKIKKRLLIKDLTNAL